MTSLQNQFGDELKIKCIQNFVALYLLSTAKRLEISDFRPLNGNLKKYLLCVLCVSAVKRIKIGFFYSLIADDLSNFGGGVL
jgi:hypothetical protein